LLKPRLQSSAIGHDTTSRSEQAGPAQQRNFNDAVARTNKRAVVVAQAGMRHSQHVHALGIGRDHSLAVSVAANMQPRCVCQPFIQRAIDEVRPKHYYLASDQYDI
jgi:hypothetical protein